MAFLQFRANLSLDDLRNMLIQKPRVSVRGGR
jgi:hypothetical protein